MSPEGDIDWEFRDPQSGTIHVAPTIGPDGLLYGAFSVGSGVFALDPATGALQWSNIGNPRISDKGTLGTEMKFGAVGPGLPKDQLYFHMRGGAGLYAFSLGGNQLFTLGLAGNDSHEPAVGSDGTIYTPRFLGHRVVALEPIFGATLWEYDGGWATGVADVEIGPEPDDILYFVGGASLLEAFDPHSLRRLWRKSLQSFLGVPSISPDGSTLVVGGDAGSAGFVKGINPRNGKELWTVTLPSAPYPGFRSYPMHHARITPDSSTAYVSTVTGEDLPLVTDKGTFLVAIDLGSKGGGGGRGKPPKKP